MFSFELYRANFKDNDIAHLLFSDNNEKDSEIKSNKIDFSSDDSNNDVTDESSICEIEPVISN